LEAGCTDTDSGNGSDTLDLQDHDTPSAKDHTKQPEHPNPLGSGRPAPHQELSIRHAEQDSKSEILNGPASNGNHEYRDGVGVYGEAEETDEEIGHNGEYDHEEDGDLADGESDDLMDDDMMDKLSSSPSIDDGALIEKVLDIRPELIERRGYRFRIRLCASQFHRNRRWASKRR
jgi:hypothetical protein